MVPWTCFEMWRPCFPHGVHHYRIVLRGKSYDAEKNGKLIGQFAELEPAQRCIEASAQRAGRGERGGWPGSWRRRAQR